MKVSREACRRDGGGGGGNPGMSVIPAEAEIQGVRSGQGALDSRLHGNDGKAHFLIADFGRKPLQTVSSVSR